MPLSRKLLMISLLSTLTLALALVGCARARPKAPAHARPAKPSATATQASTKLATSISPPSSTKPKVELPASASRPAVRAAASRPRVDRRAALRRAIDEVLAEPLMRKVRVSVVARELALDKSSPPAKARLVAVAPDARRVPASNAKLLTSAAALKLIPGHRFRTEVYRRGSRVYLRGGGDPLLSAKDLMRLARQAKSRGLRSVRHVYVDDSYFSRKQLAPGFERFLAGAPYRPTCGGLNVGANAITIRVSAPERRRRPRVDVLPPSDYVKVRKQVRYSRARRGKAARKRRVRVQMRPRGSILWLTISGIMGRKAKTYVSRRAVYDPALNAGWAFRRALKKVGVHVKGIVTRGRAPRKGRVVASRTRSLGAVLHAVNKASHNLAAETLIRAIGRGSKPERKRRRSEWPAGLARASAALRKLGMRQFALKNGSGLHRSTTVTAADMVRLLTSVWENERLRRRLLPTLSVAGRVGTLAPRMRDTVAKGVVRGKTGTLGSVLALSGYALPPKGHAGGKPLAFSVLVNGSARRAVQRRIDAIATLLARYALGLPIIEGQPENTPADMRAPTATQRPIADAGEGKSKAPKRDKLGKLGKLGKAVKRGQTKLGVLPPRRTTPISVAPIPPLPKLPPRANR